MLEVKASVDERLASFPLCRSCAERQGGLDFPLAGADDACYICRGLSARLADIAGKVLSQLRSYSFNSFSIGLILPQGVQESEDTLRSEFKIRGNESVKAAFARGIGDIIARDTRRRVEKHDPELNVLVSLDDGKIEVLARSLLLYGAYSKPRGVGQRRLFCERCNGTGCERCGGSGYDSAPSVESVVGKRFERLFGAGKVKFTWMGSEDADSRVVGPGGRPFIAELKNPKRRKLPAGQHTLRFRTGKGEVKVSRLKVLRAWPKKLPGFVFRANATIESPQRVSQRDLNKMSARMKNTLVQYHNSKGRLTYKRIHSVRARSRGTKVIADIKMEGGLPVKRLVSGESVSPSISELLGTSLRCQRFDVTKVWLSDGFQFD